MGPMAVAGEFARRKYIDERVMVYAVGPRNLVLVNEQGTFSVTPVDAFKADYIGLPKRAGLGL
jgi:hypothetical protein